MHLYKLAFFQNLSSWELILIFLVVLLFFGANRLPALFNSLGKSLKEFKKGAEYIEDEMKSAVDSEVEKDENQKDSESVHNDSK